MLHAAQTDGWTGFKKCPFLVAGLFPFNHSGGTSRAIPGGPFQDPYDGPMFGEREIANSDP